MKSTALLVRCQWYYIQRLHRTILLLSENCTQIFFILVPRLLLYFHFDLGLQTFYCYVRRPTKLIKSFMYMQGYRSCNKVLKERSWHELGLGIWDKWLKFSNYYVVYGLHVSFGVFSINNTIIFFQDVKLF